MFERFSNRARRVVVLAQEEARLLDHNYIGTEHLLLGLIHERESGGAQALVAFGISLGAARARVAELAPPGTGAPSGHIPFTPRAKASLELTLRESLQLGHNYIDTGHILLGLMRREDGVAVSVLQSFGKPLDGLREAALQQLDTGDQEIGGNPTATTAPLPAGDALVDTLQWLDRIQVHVGPEPMLLSLIRDVDGAAAQLLAAAGTDVPQLRQDLIARLDPESEGREPADGSGEHNTD